MKFEYDKLYDAQGNEKENYIIERFKRGRGGNWYKDCEYTTHNTNTFVIDDKIYYKSGNNLLLSNMEQDLKYLAYERIKCKDADYVKLLRNKEMINRESDNEIYQSFLLRCEEYSNGEKHYFSEENVNNYKSKYKDESLDTLKLRLKGEIRAVRAYIDTLKDKALKTCESERESFLEGILKAVEEIENRGIK